MPRHRCLVIATALFLAAALTAGARSSRYQDETSARNGYPSFDYYVLSLSWSPDFCATHQDAPECGGVKKFGFVVHGLWPQREHGYPQDCAGPDFNPGEVPPDLYDIMPSKTLVRHEWQTHGTCSGLAERDYFALVEHAFEQTTIPTAYRQPLQQIEVSPRDIQENFAKSNPGSSLSAFSVQCSGNRFLKEVRACLTKDLKPRACGSDIQSNCHATTIILRPLR
jgi:ribonuclease T2